ncbi:MAG: triose-phosphate isomerase [Rickettsiales bacterium]|nr:triose-phosphate isomerase [Rickettsiales bacterium]
MKKLIVANWKMNHAFDEADSWITSFIKNSSANKDQMQNCQAVVCPPVFIIDYVDSELMDEGFKKLDAILKDQKKDISEFPENELIDIILNERPVRLGAQDCHYQDSGSFTGDISATMIKKIGCEYVIVGHSERRAGHFETNEIVAKKVKSAIANGLTPIICVGESKETRDQNQHLKFVYQQIINSVPKDVRFEQLIIAYEPIWSIGTGLVPSLEQISEMAKLVRKIFKEKLSNLAEECVMLYGGSVNSENSKEILSISGVGGLLVGKASLDAEEFFKICVCS